jgi:alpha-N-acetylglucosamine transferase
MVKVVLVVVMMIMMIGYQIGVQWKKEDEKNSNVKIWAYNFKERGA